MAAHIQKTTPPTSVRPSWPISEIFGYYARLIDSTLEPLARKSLTLEQWRDCIEELLERSITDDVKKNEGIGDAIVDHIRWRLELPTETINWPTRIPSYVPPPREMWISLAGPSQHRCILDWFCIELEMWTNEDWRDCMTLRYDHPHVTPLEWLSPDLKSELDSMIAEFKGKSIKGEFPENWIGKVAELVNEKQRRPSLIFNVAVYYVSSEMQESGSDFHRRLLHEPVSNGSFFRSVSLRLCKNERQFVRESIVGLDEPPLSRDSFVRYLSIPDGHELELAGRVLHHLLRLESWNEDLFLTPLSSELAEVWPGARITDAYDNLPDFKEYARILSERLEIDPRVLNRVSVAFISMWMDRALSRQWDGQGAVFWAARIIEALDPDRCRSYREWIRFLQSRLRKGSGSGASFASNEPHTEALTRSLLSADPLLNSIFHSDAFHGLKQAGGAKTRPIMDPALINATLSYAALEMLDCVETPTNPSVMDILNAMDPLPEQLGFLAQPAFWDTPETVEVGPKSVYSFLTPIAIILFGDTSVSFTPARVKSRCLSNTRLPDVVAFRKDWIEHSKALLRMNS